MTRNTIQNQKGNTVVIVLLGALVIALGGYAVYLTQKVNSQQAMAATPPAAVETASGAEAPAKLDGAPGSADVKTANAPVIKPGNPTVAKVNGKELKRADVLGFIQTLPPQAREVPIDKLFPLALEQVVSSQVVMDKTKNLKLDNDPEVVKQMAAAKDQIMRTVYLQKEVDKQINDQKLKDAYDEYVKNFPAVEEVKARHILVKYQAKAQDLIKKLNEGGDFAKLAEENSTDATAKNGGDLGYFAQADVVPEFGKAAFETPPGTYTKEPVKTKFGYHVIKVEDKRKRSPASFDDIKPALNVQIRRQILEKMVADWRKSSDVEVFDINGDKAQMKPADGKAG